MLESTTCPPSAAVLGRQADRGDTYGVTKLRSKSSWQARRLLPAACRLLPSAVRVGRCALAAGDACCCSHEARSSEPCLLGTHPRASELPR